MFKFFLPLFEPLKMIKMLSSLHLKSTLVFGTFSSYKQKIEEGRVEDDVRFLPQCFC